MSDTNAPRDTAVTPQPAPSAERAADTTPPGRAPRVRHAPRRVGRWLAGTWRRLPLAWRRAIVAALVLRAGLAVFAFVSGGLLPGLAPVSVPPAGPGFEGWVARAAVEQGTGLLGAGLERFDALWYLAIARDGYPAADGGLAPDAAAFFPAYPLLTGLLGRLLGGAYLLAGSAVSLGATVAGLAGIHTLVTDETGDVDLARRALVAAAVFPSAFFLVAPYTEALFLALSVWALVLAHRRRWGWAAGLAFATGATRNIGVLLAVALGLEVLRQWQAGWRPTRGALAAASAAPAGLGAYMLFGWARWGAPFAPVDVQSGWQRELVSPLTSLSDAARFAVNTPGQFATGYHSLDLLIFVPVVAAVVWLLVRTPLPYGAYALAHVLVWVLFPFPSRPLMSTPRFALAVAPLFWAFAAFTRRRGAETAWWVGSAMLLGMQALLFVGWYYVF